MTKESYGVWNNRLGTFTEKKIEERRQPMTKEEILKMEAGPEIDALFAELVMKKWVEWKKEFSWSDTEIPIIIGSGHHRPELPVPNYSTNISHAMEGVEKWSECQVVISRIVFHAKEAFQWACSFDGIMGIAKTSELAITRALILWAMEKK